MAKIKIKADHDMNNVYRIASEYNLTELRKLPIIQAPLIKINSDCVLAHSVSEKNLIRIEKEFIEIEGKENVSFYKVETCSFSKNNIAIQLICNSDGINISYEFSGKIISVETSMPNKYPFLKAYAEAFPLESIFKEFNGGYVEESQLEEMEAENSKSKIINEKIGYCSGNFVDYKISSFFGEFDIRIWENEYSHQKNLIDLIKERAEKCQRNY